MSNEITLKLNCNMKEISDILENKGFKVIEKYVLNDTYFIPQNLNIKNMNYRDILSKSVLLRNITGILQKYEIVKLTIKKKKIDENGTILSQSKIDCEILDTKSGISFLKAIGYNQLMNIKEIDTVYENSGLKIAIKDIENGELLIEVETQNSNELNTIEKIKQKIIELQLPIDTKDFFVKKAEIELKKIL